MLNVQDYQFNFNFFRCHLFHSLKARTLCSAVFWERCCQRPWCVTWRTTRPNVSLRYSWESLIRQRPSGAVRWGRNAAAVTYLTGSCLTANIWSGGILKTHHNWTFLFPQTHDDWEDRSPHRRLQPQAAEQHAGSVPVLSHPCGQLPSAGQRALLQHLLPQTPLWHHPLPQLAHSRCRTWLTSHTSVEFTVSHFRKGCKMNPCCRRLSFRWSCWKTHLKPGREKWRRSPRPCLWMTPMKF